MPKSLLPLTLALLLTGAAHAASRYAGEFLGLGAGARSAALGSAYVAPRGPTPPRAIGMRPAYPPSAVAKRT